jgi:hypothetical protein
MIGRFSWWFPILIWVTFGGGVVFGSVISTVTLWASGDCG